MTKGGTRGGARLLGRVAGAALSDEVTQRLSDAIHLGLFAKGEQLPAEAVLAGQLGVATATLREALAELRRQGLVVTKRGRNGGSFVVGPAAVSAARARGRLRQLSVVELRDLGDEWMAVSGTAARLAADRASASEVDHLRTFAAALGVARSCGERLRANSRFAVELALVAQSRRLTQAEVRLQSEFGELLWTSIDPPLDAAAVAADLHAVVDAIAAEDAPLARDRAEQRTQRNVRWLVGAHLALGEAG